MSDVIKCDTCDTLIDPVADRHWTLQREGPLLMRDNPNRVDFCGTGCLAEYVRARAKAEVQR